MKTPIPKCNRCDMLITYTSRYRRASAVLRCYYFFSDPDSSDSAGGRTNALTIPAPVGLITVSLLTVGVALPTLWLVRLELGLLDDMIPSWASLSKKSLHNSARESLLAGLCSA